MSVRVGALVNQQINLRAYMFFLLFAFCRDEAGQLSLCFPSYAIIPTYTIIWNVRVCKWDISDLFLVRQDTQLEPKSMFLSKLIVYHKRQQTLGGLQRKVHRPAAVHIINVVQ